MAILAIDWGAKHIGLAISYSGILAEELAVLSNKPGVIDNLRKMVSDHDVDTIVVGLPTNSDGSPATIAAKVREFGAALKNATNIHLVFEDEHLTSKAAVEALKDKVDPADNRIDSFAAKLILEQYLVHNSKFKSQNANW